MKETAADHYKARRGNCAQAVALAWKDKRHPDSNHHDRLSGSGRGQAPEGTCGALHAACEIAGDPLKETIIDQFSRQTAGHISCLEIRRNRALPCPDCVATAAGLLDDLTKETR